MSAQLLEPDLLSFEEFLEQYDGVHCEWVDGKIELMSPVTRLHQNIGGFLATLLRLYAVKYDAGVVFEQTFLMRLPSKPSGREPDLMFVAKSREHLIQNTYVEGGGDLVIEIVSPDSIERDHVTKLREYQVGGIPEYWIVDGWKKEIWFYQLDETGKYQRVEPNSDGIYRSVALPGFWINVAWLWENPLPMTKALKKLRLP